MKRNRTPSTPTCIWMAAVCGVTRSVRFLLTITCKKKEGSRPSLFFTFSHVAFWQFVHSVANVRRYALRDALDYFCHHFCQQEQS